MAEAAQGSRKKLKGARTGVVMSVSGRKTVRVFVDALVRHPRYSKYVRHRTKLAVHDPDGAAKPGDVVEVAPCRPISKTKAWRLVRIVRAAL